MQNYLKNYFSYVFTTGTWLASQLNSASCMAHVMWHAPEQAPLQQCDIVCATKINIESALRSKKKKKKKKPQQQTTQQRLLEARKRNLTWLLGLFYSVCIHTPWRFNKCSRTWLFINQSHFSSRSRFGSNTSNIHSLTQSLSHKVGVCWWTEF